MVSLRPRDAQLFPLLVIAVYVVLTAAIPYLYGGYLAPLLALSLVVIAMLRRVSGVAVPWTVLLVTLGLVGAAIGFASGNLGARPTLTIFVIEPLVLGLLIGSVSRLDNWERWVLLTLDAALVGAVGLGFALYLASSADVVLPGWLVDPDLAYVDTTQTTLRTNFQGFNSLVFLAPYGIARYVWRAPTDRRWWALLMFALAVAGVLMAGRRVLYLTVPAMFVAIVGLFLLRWFMSRPRRLAPIRTALDATWAVVASAVVVGVLGLATDLGATAILDRSASQVTLSETAPAETEVTTAAPSPELGVRELQSAELLEEWAESPVWGKGSGAVPDDYVRAPETPWSFELTYHVILFNFGLIGLVVLGLWASWITVWLLRSMWRGDALSAAVGAGFAGTALASALDPYIFKLDGMWMVFIPFGVAVAARTASLLHTENGPSASDGKTITFGNSSTTRSPGAVLVGVVAYKNQAQVQSFIDTLREQDPELAIAVCDNSPDGVDDRKVFMGVDASTYRADNPGYMDGGIAAFEAFQTAHPERDIDWAILTNTDLEFAGETFSRVLSAHDPERSIVLAPRITEGDEQVEKNPHLSAARSTWRLWINHLATGSAATAMGFLVAAVARFKMRHGGGETRPLSEPGTAMYAPYGATMIFSRGFLAQVGLPTGVPLLAEEFAIAELAARGASPILFEPAIHLLHEPHSTTGPKVGYIRAAMLSRAFTWMHRAAELR